ncbi:MAG TPA: NAD-dependent epimerase/dehydratase family protein [Anaerolineaceae bacterium]|nr:NAD-dependent epimerase/dehydratase family protein [Anaerolineaceae bacterium]
MNVLVIGGTGLLGYHATLELLKRGHRVSVLALPPLPVPDLFPASVSIQFGNLNLMDDDAVVSLLSGQDAVVFAAGADDRVTPIRPAYPYFYKQNVEPVKRLASLGRKTGLKKLVILGSYFAYFDRTWPRMKLSTWHPYIRSRVEQTRAAIEAGGDQVAVMTLELPYIFGTMPGRLPLWKPLIKYVASNLPLLYPRGGTTCVTVTQVAQSIAGAVERGEAGKCYPVGGENLTWEQLLQKFVAAAGKRKRVIILSDGLVRLGTRLVKLLHQFQGREGGLDPVRFVELQTANTFIDPAESQFILGYSPADLDAAIRETVAVCLGKTR